MDLPLHNHYLPQNYLRQFAPPSHPDQVWCFNKLTGELKLLPIKSVGQRKDFYGPQTEELLNTQIEGPAQYALAKLRNGEPLDRGGKTRVTLYLDSMRKRVPPFRQQMVDRYPLEKEEFFARVKHDLKGWASHYQTTPSDLLDAMNEFELHHFNEPMGMTDPLVRFQWVSPRWIELILSMTWRVLRVCGSERFLAGDNPVYLLKRTSHSLLPPGLIFPLSSTEVLHANWEKSRGGWQVYEDAKPAQIREINRQTIQISEHFLFSQREDSWVTQVIQNQTYGAFRKHA